METFRNTVKMSVLEDAVANWFFNNDGYDGAIGGITIETLVWTPEMEKVLPWEEVSPMIGRAIGNRPEFSPTGFIRSDEYVKGFREIVWNRARNIMDAYEKALDMLNDKLISKRAVIQEGDLDGKYTMKYNDVHTYRGATWYEVFDAVYGSTYAEMSGWKRETFFDVAYETIKDGGTIHLKDNYSVRFVDDSKTDK